MKPEWGTKRACRKCAANFYDLNKPEFKCPKCEAPYTPQDFVIKSTRVSSEATLKKETMKKESRIYQDSMIDDLDKVLDDDELETDLEEEDIIEDTSDLEDDDFHEVMKHDTDHD